MTEVSNLQDVIDSRDVIARIEELKPYKVVRKYEFGYTVINEFATRDEAADFFEQEDFNPERIDIDEEEDELIELDELQKLEEQASSSPDWEYGATLVRDSYFKEFAQDEAESLGLISDDASWPNTFIDWDAASEALKMDYFSVEFGEQGNSVTYWIRA